MHNGEKLKKELKKLRITQEELAEKLGISRNYLIILTKEYRIKQEYRDRIIKALGLSTTFFEEENVNTNKLNSDNIAQIDLKHYRMGKRLSQKEFAESLDITQGYLSELEHYKKEVSDSIKYKILEIYGDDISQLTESTTTYLNNEKQQTKKERSEGVPFYDVDVAASAGVEMFNDKNEIPNYHYNVPGFEDCDFAVPVFGHSMYPTYENGTVIMCKKINDKTLIIYGEAYLVVTKDYRMVKRLQKSETKGSVLACSDNEEERDSKGQKKYEPFEIPIDKIIHLYLIKGVIKRNQL